MFRLLKNNIFLLMEKMTTPPLDLSYYEKEVLLH